MKPESTLYRGYELQIVRHMPMWQIGIYPTAPDMLAPRPEAQIVSLGDKEAALAEARRRVDMLIAA